MTPPQMPGTRPVKIKPPVWSRFALTKGNQMRSNNNQNRRNGIIAAALGAALLLGGGTYALWTSAADLAVGDIRSGQMSITAGEAAAFDISPDRLDKTADPVTAEGVTVPGTTGAPIDLETWRMVPGDTVALLFGYDIVLSGANLVAHLTLDGIDVANGFDNLALTCALYDGDGNVLLPTGPLPATDTPLKVLGAGDSGTVVLVIYATFDPTTSGQDDTNVALDLASAVTMTLTQARAA